MSWVYAGNPYIGKRVGVFCVNPADVKSSSYYIFIPYAKNVIQYNINLFQSTQTENNTHYRDELTEGYNITPNFFIQAYIDAQNLTDSADHFQFDETQKAKINFHFENRIFDRDTLGTEIK